MLAVAIGAFNGWLLMRTGLPSFLVTLGTFFILQGVNLGVTRLVDRQRRQRPTSATWTASPAPRRLRLQVTIGAVNVKITVLYWLVLIAIGAYVLLRTRIGNWIFAVGGDAAAARAVGVPVRSTKIGLFMAVGFCAWFVRHAPAVPVQHRAVRRGRRQGVHLHHRRGHRRLPADRRLRLGGRVASIGALIFGMIQLGIVYAGWNPDWFKAFLGVMLLLATIVNLVREEGGAR